MVYGQWRGTYPRSLDSKKAQNSTGVVTVTSTAPMERARFYCALWEQGSHPDHPFLSPLFYSLRTGKWYVRDG
jgi:hypothetical protein